MRLWLALFGALLAFPAPAQLVVTSHPRSSTVAAMPAAAGAVTVGGVTYIRTWWVTDGQNSGDPCDAGSGTTQALCGDFGVVAGWNQINESGGGGPGDITDVWSATTGNVNALTAAAGDTLDCGSADSCSPAPRSTTLPATCTEGFFYQDTDSTGSEVYACTAANTWTKFLAAADIDTSAELATILGDEVGGSGGFVRSTLADGDLFDASAVNDSSATEGLRLPQSSTEGNGTAEGQIHWEDDVNGIHVGNGSTISSVCMENGANCPASAGGEYNPDNYPPAANCYGCDEFTAGAESLTWAWGNQGSCSVDGSTAMDHRYVNCPDTADANSLAGRWTATPGDAVGNFILVLKVTDPVWNTNAECGLWVLTGGDAATPTEIYTLGYVTDTTNTTSFRFRRWTSYTALSSTIQTINTGRSDDVGNAEDAYLMFEFTDSSNALTPAFSFGGHRFANPFTPQTDVPTQWGFYCDKGAGTAAKVIDVHFARGLDANYAADATNTGLYAIGD